MAVITANTGSNNWNTNGAWVGAVQPGVGDDVIIPATAVVTIPAAVTVLGRSCTISASGTLAWAATTSILQLGDATAGAGNVAFSNAGTLTLTAVGVINFISTNTTVQTITTGGATMPSYTVNGVGSKYQLADSNTTSGTVTLTSGTLNTNGQSCSWGLFSGTGATARTITMGSSAITISGGGATAWNCTTATNLTITANTATVTLSGASSTFLSGSANWNGLSLVFNGSGNASLGNGGATFANVTRTGTAVKTDTFIMATVLGFTITGTLTLTGQSVTNRLLCNGATTGSAATLTAAVVSLTNVDFEDIKGSGTASPFTGTSLGDCLGNSGITFDTPVSQTWSGNTTGNWSDVTKWTSRVPLPQDNVSIPSLTSGVITCDMPRMGANIDLTGSTAGGFVNGTATTSYGNVTLVSAAFFPGSANPYTLSGRSAQTITSNGGTFAANSISITAPGGSYTLQDNAIFLRGLFIVAGTFSANNHNVTNSVGGFANGVAVNGSITRVVNMGSGTWTLGNTATAIVWGVSGSNVTINAGTSTIAITDTSGAIKTFAGGGFTYNNLTISGGAASQTIITGANTFNTIATGTGVVLTMPASTTNTATTFNVNGTNYGYEYLPGVASNYASAPNAVPLQITGDITIDVKLALVNYASVSQIFVSKYGTTNNEAFLFYTISTGQLAFQTSSSGVPGVGIIAATSAAHGVVNGATTWFRVSCQVNNGSGSALINFYKSSDGVTWTQIGTTTTTTASTIFNSPSVLELGSYFTGNLPMTGSLYEAKLYNSNLLTASGTPVFDANFTTKAFGANSFTESSSNAATVTINGVIAQAGDGRVMLNSSTGGTQATMTSSGQQSVDYLTIQDSKVDASPKWYAGAHSVSVSNNTNWIFTAPPIISTGGTMLLMGV